MNATTKSWISKLVTIVVGLIAIVLGCVAHFNSAAKTLWDQPESTDASTNAISMERAFIGVTIICLILSAVSLVAGFLVDLTSFRTIDGGYHVLGGILVLIAGILMITSAGQIDNDVTESINRTHPFRDGLIREMRQDNKHYDKLAAGATAIFNGIIYFVTAGVIFESK